MATNNYLRGAGLVGAFVLGFVALGQTVTGPAPKEPIGKRYPERWYPTEQAARQAWLDSAKTEAWVREKAGRNNHPRIALYNRLAGAQPRDPYCASGLNFAARKAGLKFPLQQPSAVRGWFADRNLIIYDRTWGANRWRSQAQLMDVLWLFNSHVEGLAQAYVPRDIDDDEYVQTMAFNSRGKYRYEGVYFPMWRRWGDVRRVANHVTPYWKNRQKQLNSPTNDAQTK